MEKKLKIGDVLYREHYGRVLKGFDWSQVSTELLDSVLALLK